MKAILLILFVPVSIYLVSINLRLGYSPTFTVQKEGFVNEAVHRQLNFLKVKMHDGAATDMQKLFPEGFVFMNALYGLAWCNQLENSGGFDSPLMKEGKIELDWVQQQLNSQISKSIFNPDLPLENGAFYNGWTGYFEGKRLSLLEPSLRDSTEVADFKQRCKKIATALSQSESPWLESYHLNAWPADNIVCLAALSVHDKLFSPQFQGLKIQWLKKVLSLTDPDTGLIPHSVHQDGSKLEGARGSSQTLMLTFLPEIDTGFAKEQLALFKKNFADKLLGLPAVREYPFGKEGDGDIDSGPVFFGMGGAASIVGISAYQNNGELLTASRLRNEVEGLGFPLNFGGKKRYFFGAIPIADAFVAWVDSFQDRPDEFSGFAIYRLGFHAFSLVVLIILYVLWRYLTRN